jgi:hypothetical protein
MIDTDSRRLYLLSDSEIGAAPAPPGAASREPPALRPSEQQPRWEALAGLQGSRYPWHQRYKARALGAAEINS